MEPDTPGANRRGFPGSKKRQPQLIVANPGKKFLAAFTTLCLVVACPVKFAMGQPPDGSRLRVLTFNILQGGGSAANVGFRNESFAGSRIDEIAEVILLSQASLVGIQEDASDDGLLRELNRKSESTWYRFGNIYSRFRLRGIEKSYGLTMAEVDVARGRRCCLVNCHWAPSPYGPTLAQEEIQKHGRPKSVKEFESRILGKSNKTNGRRGIQRTIAKLKELRDFDAVFLTGDFNEPSHLDWTDRHALEGEDRWVSNPTGIPLRFRIQWSGSSKLEGIGMKDAYREAHRNEVKMPGITWTPAYPVGTPGRRPYKDQVLDRIDRVYYRCDHLELVSADVIGEKSRWSAIVYPGRWPSDHRAVVAEFKWKPDKK